MDLYDWIEATRPYHATIASISALPPGLHRFVCLDRNVCDTTWGRPEGPAASFFDGGYWLVLRRTDPPGSFGAESLGTTQVLCDRDEELGEFNGRELDIQYMAGRWRPLENGRVPSWLVPGAPAAVGTNPTWAEFPPETRVGWRGPMIPEAALERLPALAARGA